jgi:hypothetical protein
VSERERERERERKMVCATCLYTYVCVKERPTYIVYVCAGGDIREERGRISFTPDIDRDG